MPARETYAVGGPRDPPLQNAEKTNESRTVGAGFHVCPGWGTPARQKEQPPDNPTAEFWRLI